MAEQIQVSLARKVEPVTDAARNSTIYHSEARFAYGAAQLPDDFSLHTSNITNSSRSTFSPCPCGASSTSSSTFWGHPCQSVICCGIVSPARDDLAMVLARPVQPPTRLVMMTEIRIAAATEADAPLILDLIRALAEYEKLSHAVTATEEQLRQTLFGTKPAAEVLLAYWEQECAGFAIFFPTYSTFLAQPGIYLEDLYVKPHLRGRGIGLALLRRLAAIAIERRCGRLEWAVLNWNEPAIGFYRKLQAAPLDEWTTYRLTGHALARLAANDAPGKETLAGP